MAKLKRKTNELLDLTIEAKKNVTKVVDVLELCKMKANIYCKPSNPDCENIALNLDGVS